MSSKALDLYMLLTSGNQTSETKLTKVVVVAESPARLTIVGSDLAYDVDLFEVPVAFLPLRTDDSFFALPVHTAYGDRWGLITRTNR